MALKFELASFYKLFKLNPEFDAEQFLLLTTFSIEKIQELLQKCKVIDKISAGDTPVIETAQMYFETMQITHPGFICFADILGSKIADMLCEKKVLCSEQVGSDNSIVLVPCALDSEIDIAKTMELNNNIRDFFTLFPYSTVKEAAKAIRTTPQKIRTAAEILRNNGEDIKFNNTPVIMEREQISKEIIKLKTEEPALTIHEISRRLGVSISEVNLAIKNMIYVWKMEKADNYDFYLYKTSNSIDLVEAEAWKQHEQGGTRPSSRWLEIALMAIEKRITIHGLKAPDKIDITNRDARSKDERDNIIDVAFEADTLDIDTTKIQITGS
jgi:hypothetical protein